MIIKKFKIFEQAEVKPIEKYTLSQILELSKFTAGMRRVYNYAQVNNYIFSDYTIRGIVHTLKEVYRLNSHDNNLYSLGSSQKVISVTMEKVEPIDSRAYFNELIKNRNIYTFRIEFRLGIIIHINVESSFMYKFLFLPEPASTKPSIIMPDDKPEAGTFNSLVWDKDKMEWISTDPSYNKNKEILQNYYQKSIEKKPIGFQIPQSTPKKVTSTKEIKDLLKKIRDKKK